MEAGLDNNESTLNFITFLPGIYTKFQSIDDDYVWPPEYCKQKKKPNLFVNVGSYARDIWNTIKRHGDDEECQSPTSIFDKRNNNAVLVEEPCTCGQQNDRLRMENGKEISSKGFPWTVIIRSSTNTSTICAGALISDRLVVTSKQCADLDLPQYLTVGIGKRENDLGLVFSCDVKVSKVSRIMKLKKRLKTCSHM